MAALPDLNKLLKYDFNLSINFDPLKAALSTLAERQSLSDAKLATKADSSVCERLAEGAAAAVTRIESLESRQSAADARTSSLTKAHEKSVAETQGAIDGLDTRVSVLEAASTETRVDALETARAIAEALAAAEDASSRAVATEAALREVLASSAAAGSSAPPVTYVPPPPRPAAADQAAAAAAAKAAAEAAERIVRLEADNASLRSLMESALQRLGAVEEGAQAAATAHGALASRVAALEWAAAERDARGAPPIPASSSGPAPQPMPPARDEQQLLLLRTLDSRLSALEVEAAAARARPPPAAVNPIPPLPSRTAAPAPAPPGVTLAAYTADRAATDTRAEALEASLAGLRSELSTLGKRVGADVTGLQAAVAALQAEAAALRAAVADAATASADRLEAFWLIIQRCAWGEGGDRGPYSGCLHRALPPHTPCSAKRRRGGAGSGGLSTRRVFTLPVWLARHGGA